MRRGEDEIAEADRITAGDMMRSLELHEALLVRRRAASGLAEEPAEPGEPALQERPAAENVTPLALGERKRGDP